MSEDLPQSATALSAFILEMHASLLAHPDKWENRTLPRFLEALAAVAQSYEQGCMNMNVPLPPDEVWPAMAEMLHAAQIYE